MQHAMVSCTVAIVAPTQAGVPLTAPTEAEVSQGRPAGSPTAVGGSGSERGATLNRHKKWAQHSSYAELLGIVAVAEGAGRPTSASAAA